jgi:cytidylate kinase
VIAVDGPSGSGKSTVSRRLAERLGWLHLDTGAYYRAATLAALRAGVDLEDEEQVLLVVEGLRLRQERGRMLLASEDVSVAIRSADVTTGVSAVAAHPRVRKVIVRQQQQWVAGHHLPAVVEGRDIGTVVFPDAMLKIWLEASETERVRRRAAETGISVDLVQQDLSRRDRADSGREASPLRPASDAIHLDTTNLGVESVVDRILGLMPSSEVFPERV